MLLKCSRYQDIALKVPEAVIGDDFSLCKAADAAIFFDVLEQAWNVQPRFSVNGAAVASPKRVDAAKYSTLVTGARGEVVVALSLIGVSATLVMPFAGVAMVTVGGSLTVMVIGVPSTGAPVAGTTRGVTIYFPVARLDNKAAKGAAVARITTPLSTRYSTLVMGLGAAAIAVKFTL